MTFSATTATAIAFYGLLIIQSSSSRELRPSYHGLDYQNSAVANHSPEMLSFFGASPSSSSSSSSTSSPLISTQPNAVNSNVTAWRRSNGSGGSDGDRVKEVLLIASLACGVVGAVLLVASATLLLLRFRNQRSSSSSCNDNTANPK